jgi:MFS family permease
VSARVPVLVFALCAAEVIGMLGFAAFPALLPTFMAEWSLTATEAGWINGLYYLGYLLSVPVLMSLTDRGVAKPIYLWCMVLTAFSSAAFAVWAQGFWTAAAFRFLAGVGLAGTYMPGLKILSDVADGPGQSRAVAFYTASFSIGSSLSFLFIGELAAARGWAAAFGWAALGPLAALALAYAVVPPRRPAHEDAPPDTHLLDFRPVLRCRAAMGYVLAYAAHNFELFAWRSWIVAFLVFAGLKQAGAGWLTASVIATAVNMIGLPASIIGNEIATRFGRRRVVGAVMGASAVLACAVGFSAEMPIWVVVGACLVYGVTVTGDSASITAGLIEEAPDGRRGAAMAVHACIGFTGAFLGPLAFGAALDVGGGAGALAGWVAAFVVTGAVVAMGPVALAVMHRRAAPGVPPARP